ncbi:MAG: hypothetical protein U0946_05960, partial [Patescibacteria group bacterium]|nr:hypothetical protein [Patescibacteria group bacterium]
YYKSKVKSGSEETGGTTFSYGDSRTIYVNDKITTLEFGWGGTDPASRIVFDHNGYLFIVYLNHMGMDLDEYEKFNDLIYQIISTFKFTD